MLCASGPAAGPSYRRPEFPGEELGKHAGRFQDVDATRSVALFGICVVNVPFIAAPLADLPAKPGERSIPSRNTPSRSCSRASSSFCSRSSSAGVSGPAGGGGTRRPCGLSFGVPHPGKPGFERVSRNLPRLAVAGLAGSTVSALAGAGALGEGPGALLGYGLLGLAGPALAVVYLVLTIRASRSGLLPSSVGAVGRMSLTAYVLQGVLAGLVFAG